MRYSVDERNPLEGTEIGNRPSMFDSQYSMITLNETIEFVRDLNQRYPNVNRMGLNIELKCAQ